MIVLCLLARLPSYAASWAILLGWNCVQNPPPQATFRRKESGFSFNSPLDFNKGADVAGPGKNLSLNMLHIYVILMSLVVCASGPSSSINRAQGHVGQISINLALVLNTFDVRGIVNTVISLVSSYALPVMCQEERKQSNFY